MSLKMLTYINCNYSDLKCKRNEQTLNVFSSSTRVPTLALWGTSGGVVLVYMTDWRVIMDYVPYVNGKFKKDD